MLSPEIKYICVRILENLHSWKIPPQAIDVGLNTLSYLDKNSWAIDLIQTLHIIDDVCVALPWTIPF